MADTLLYPCGNHAPCRRSEGSRAKNVYPDSHCFSNFQSLNCERNRESWRKPVRGAHGRGSARYTQEAGQFATFHSKGCCGRHQKLSRPSLYPIRIAGIRPSLVFAQTALHFLKKNYPLQNTCLPLCLEGQPRYSFQDPRPPKLRAPADRAPFPP